MLRKTTLGTLALVVFTVLALLIIGKAAPVTAQGPQAAIWTDKSEYAVGDRAILCYTVPQPAYIEITDILADGTSKVILSGNDDGTGDCIEGTIEPPAGIETLQLAVYSSNRVIATAATRFQVLGTGSRSPQAVSCPGGLSADQIDDYLRCKKPRSPLIGYGAVFMRAGETYNVDPRFVVAISAIESSFGTNGDCATRHHNAWGYGGGWPSCWNFGTWEEAINQVTVDIGRRYLPNGQNTIPSFVIRPAGTCTRHCWCASGCTSWISVVRQVYEEQGGDPDTNDLTYHGNASGAGGAPAGYIFCAWEGQRCSFSGTGDVAYGANGRFAYRSGVSGGIDCNNGVFGDPVYGVRKACYFRQTSSGPAHCPGQYRAEYFANRSLSGSPVLVRCEDWPIRHDWSGGSPGRGVPDDNFSVRWTGRARIESGTYTFIARADDGIRVWLDGSRILDGWRDQPPTVYRVTRSVTAGEHTIRVEYYENGGGALAEFRWERASCNDPTEPNNTWNQGRELQSGQIVHGFICPANDRDWFKIPVLLGDRVRLRLTSLPGDYDMILYDPERREVARSEGPSTSDEEITWRVQRLGRFGGTLYLQVYGWSGANSSSDSYELRLEKTRGGEPPPAPPPSNCDGGEGVYLYEHSAFQGRCHKFTGDSPNPRSWSIGNDAASSIRIVGEWAATLYEHDDYQGASSTYEHDDGWLGDDTIGNDRASSIRVQRRSASPPAGGNIAPQAQRSPDSIGSGNAFDGTLSTFWAAGHAFNITLSWPEPVTIQRILVWDRPQNSPDNNQINRLIIRLSNGLEGRFDMESGGRRCVDVALASPQSVRSVTLIADDASGNNGLSEVEVWTGPKTSGPSCSNSKRMP